MVKDNFFYFFAILFFIFLAISLTHIHNNYDVDLTSFKGIVTASKIYYGWFLNVMGNLGKVTGYAIRQDWFTASENSTNSTNSTSYGG
ncbi:hypothetical protein HYV50_03695 [Candidatus Pacearchaeota archaeon]|nr:hypothetical protein [Candidatus Pacearchaeota archaeon]